MTPATPATPRTRAPAAAEEVGPATLLGVCASLKPPPGRADRSAVRSLLAYALDAVADTYPEVALLDLRDHPPPFFDGRLPEDREDAALRFAWSCVDRAGALLLAVPGYWCGVSGVFKNFVDTLCGPRYDLPDPVVTVFTGKAVGLLVVGADDASAAAAADQAGRIMASTGAALVGRPVVLGNPRGGTANWDAVSGELIALAAELARRAYLAAAGRGGGALP
jgi:NAD(P)H-dependent FMN reductase